MTKIYALGKGDESVGLFPDEVTIDWNIDCSDFDEDERNFLRNHIAEMVAEFSSGDRKEDISVWFEDECPDCMVKIVGKKCQTNGCPSSYEPEPLGDSNDI